MIASAEILRADLAAEDIDVTFASVKNHLLFDDGNTVKFLRSSKTCADFNRQFDIHRDMDLIKSAIERDVIHMKIGAKNFGALCPYVGRSFDQFVATVGKVNGNVLKTVFVTTTIENTVGVYIYRVTAEAAIRSIISGIRHNDDHSFHTKIRNC